MQTLRLKILYNLLKEKAIVATKILYNFLYKKAIVANDFFTKNICYNIYAKKLFFMIIKDKFRQNFYIEYDSIL